MRADATELQAGQSNVFLLSAMAIVITRFVTVETNAQILQQRGARRAAELLVPGLDPYLKMRFLGAFGHSMGAFQLTQLAALAAL